MRTLRFERTSRLPVPAEEVYRWHMAPGAFERLTPPWDPVEILDRSGSPDRAGFRVTLRTRVGPFRPRWVAEHREVEPGRGFTDVQVAGPFARWEHTHAFEPAGDHACDLVDRIEFALPGGRLGRLLAGGLVRRRLARVFAYRHRVTADDLAAHGDGSSTAPLDVRVTGRGGLIGSVLAPFLTTGGHRVRAVPRGADGRLDLDALAGGDAVVHLAGENVAGRWTRAKREAIRTSRVEGTRRLAAHLASMQRPPRVLVAASAVGFYGDRGDDWLDEDAGAGDGFLAEVGRAWEAACAPAAERGIRVVHLRFGVVLTPAGGALARMLPPFRAGLGGPLGDGRAFLSWASIDDAVAAIRHALVRDDLAGPVNVVAPEPVRNRDFARTLARTLRRPAVLPVPRLVLRAAFGAMADEVLLASARVRPARLLASGFAFRHPDLAGALRWVLGVPETTR